MKFIKIALFFLAVIGSPALCFSQSNLTEYKKQFGDFLTKLGARESQIGRIGINEVKDSVGTLYFYASENCAYISFNENNVAETYSKLRSILPKEYEGHKLAIYTQGHEISDYIPLAKRTKSSKNKIAKFVRPEVT